MRCAVALSLHSGWAVAVAVTGDPAGPEVLLRQQLDLVAADLPGQAYHVAAGRLPAAAAELIRRVERSARSLAERSLATIVEQLEAAGHTVEAVALCAEPRDLPGDLARILANHALIHSAEGELYREAVESAAVELDLPVLQVDAKRVGAEVSGRLGLAEDRQKQLVDDLGRALGPPWRIDHKRAALLGLLALADPAPELAAPTGASTR